MKVTFLIHIFTFVILICLNSVIVNADDCTDIPNYDQNKRVTLVQSMTKNWSSLGWIVGMKCNDVAKIRLDVLENFQQNADSINIFQIQNEIMNLERSLYSATEKLNLVENQRNSAQFKLILETTYVLMHKALVFISCFSPDPFTKMQCPYAVRSFIDSCMSIFDSIVEANQLSNLAENVKQKCDYIRDKLGNLYYQINSHSGRNGFNLYLEISNNLCAIINTYCVADSKDNPASIPPVETVKNVTMAPINAE